jgi:hypothetical protein
VTEYAAPRRVEQWAILTPRTARQPRASSSERPSRAHRITPEAQRAQSPHGRISYAWCWDSSVPHLGVSCAGPPSAAPPVDQARPGSRDPRWSVRDVPRAAAGCAPRGSERGRRRSVAASRMRETRAAPRFAALRREVQGAPSESPRRAHGITREAAGRARYGRVAHAQAGTLPFDANARRPPWV